MSLFYRSSVDIGPLAGHPFPFLSNTPYWPRRRQHGLSLDIVHTVLIRGCTCLSDLNCSSSSDAETDVYEHE